MDKIRCIDRRYGKPVGGSRSRPERTRVYYGRDRKNLGLAVTTLYNYLNKSLRPTATEQH